MSNQSNFKEDIEEAAGNEQIIAIRVEFFDTWSEHENTATDSKGFPRELTGRLLLDYDSVSQYLDYNYDTGFGHEDCHTLIAWTETWVLYIGAYDGATWVDKIPRNPKIDYEPNMIGGG